MIKWGNMVIGGEDPEYQVGGSALDTAMEGGMQIFMLLPEPGQESPRSSRLTTCSA